MVQGPLMDLPEPPEAERCVTVLAVSPHVEDHVHLAAIFGHSNWRISNAFGCREAIDFVSNNRVAVLISENVLPDGDWKKLLESLSSLHLPPLLIVAARHATDSLWAEALNLGAYDVLSKPFDRAEVARIVSLAWLYWREQMVQSRNGRAAMPASTSLFVLPSGSI